MALYVLFDNENTFLFLYLAFIKPTNVSDRFAGPCTTYMLYFNSVSAKVTSKPCISFSLHFLEMNRQTVQSHVL